MRVSWNSLIPLREKSFDLNQSYLQNSDSLCNKLLSKRPEAVIVPYLFPEVPVYFQQPLMMSPLPLSKHIVHLFLICVCAGFGALGVQVHSPGLKVYSCTYCSSLKAGSTYLILHLIGENLHRGIF